ncbi:glycosyltransferase family 2 protein [Acidisoma cladoniae]|uniref:glycosyltransferase family 2 protein n=1 Tax=Acidisoma cladoniae TaxID=3040935 RepID=UPI002550119F|nr:glycosyltransferase [Acidisoma sp. PAMC 29798]
MLDSLWRRSPPSTGLARVSVVVPLYNHATYIEAAIASILSQGSVVKEIIVIDDGSTDKSAIVMDVLARRDKRIVFTRQDNQGAHATLNAGLARCTGDLLAILNSDDAYMPGRLNALAAALDADAGAGIAASGLQFMDGAGVAIANPWYVEALAFHQAGADLGGALINGNFLMTTSNLMIRRAAWDSIGPFAALRYVHDLDWLLRALALGHRIARLDQDLLRYRIHTRNTISEEHSGVRVEWAITAAAYLTTLWDRPGAPPIAWDQAGAVQSVLRHHALDRAVPLCMAYLRRHGAASLDRAPLLADSAFKTILKEWV